jgi:Pyruvate/2-oxoacid:ferredoxin oxidoreductase delta subunit
MTRRKIVEIDQAKCDGCGVCVPSCAEGAIQIIDGKARLVSDAYCDGLGACLGHCPRDAITIIERESAEFDQRAAHEHVAGFSPKASAPPVAACPGSMPRDLRLPLVSPPPSREPAAAGGAESRLANWPIQLRLVPPTAPFLRQADLVLAADCVAFAFADLHREIIRGRPLLIACPKLDDAAAYVEKLADILSHAGVRSLSIVRMDVPCCAGLTRIARAAAERSGSAAPIEEIVIGIDGRPIAASPSPACTRV